jgi:hypothetical protein
MTALAVEAPPDLPAVWRRFRLPLLVAALLLSSAFIVAAIENAPPRKPLDPRDASHQGGRALAQLIRPSGSRSTRAPRCSCRTRLR